MTKEQRTILTRLYALAAKRKGSLEDLDTVPIRVKRVSDGFTRPGTTVAALERAGLVQVLRTARRQPSIADGVVKLTAKGIEKAQPREAAQAASRRSLEARLRAKADEAGSDSIWAEMLAELTAPAAHVAACLTPEGDPARCRCAKG